MEANVALSPHSNRTGYANGSLSSTARAFGKGIPPKDQKGSSLEVFKNF